MAKLFNVIDGINNLKQVRDFKFAVLETDRLLYLFGVGLDKYNMNPVGLFTLPPTMYDRFFESLDEYYPLIVTKKDFFNAFKSNPLLYVYSESKYYDISFIFSNEFYENFSPFAKVLVEQDSIKTLCPSGGYWFGDSFGMLYFIEETDASFSGMNLDFVGFKVNNSDYRKHGHLIIPFAVIEDGIYLYSWSYYYDAYSAGGSYIQFYLDNNGTKTVLFSADNFVSRAFSLLNDELFLFGKSNLVVLNLKDNSINTISYPENYNLDFGYNYFTSFPVIDNNVFLCLMKNDSTLKAVVLGISDSSASVLSEVELLSDFDFSFDDRFINRVAIKDLGSGYYLAYLPNTYYNGKPLLEFLKNGRLFVVKVGEDKSLSLVSKVEFGVPVYGVLKIDANRFFVSTHEGLYLLVFDNDYSSFKTYLIDNQILVSLGIDELDRVWGITSNRDLVLYYGEAYRPLKVVASASLGDTQEDGFYNGSISLSVYDVIDDKRVKASVRVMAVNLDVVFDNGKNFIDVETSDTEDVVISFKSPKLENVLFVYTVNGIVGG